MLGTLRFTLALLVVLNHLWEPTANRVGAPAVTAFYIISGFLMTRIIHEVYGPTWDGAKRYLANRALRIYPPYLFFLLATWTLLWAIPSSTIYSTMAIPQTPTELFSNLTLVNLTWSPSISIPPAWSLMVEMFFYIAMVAALSRRQTITIAWLALSLGYHIYLVATGASFSDRYYPLPAASLYFSIGAAVYFVLPRIAWLAPPPKVTWLLVALFCAAPLLVEAAGGDRSILGYYGATTLFIPIFVASVSGKPGTRFDRHLGDLAYPIFIVHFLAGAVVRLAFPSVPFQGLSYLILCIGVSIAASVAFVRVYDATIAKVRDRVRNRSVPVTP